MTRHPDHAYTRFERDLRDLRQAVEALRIAGVEIISAEISSFSDSPVIHVVDHPTVRAIPGRYPRARIAGSEVHAVPYLACQLTWLDPAPLPGLPASFVPLTERTAHHG